MSSGRRRCSSPGEAPEPVGEVVIEVALREHHVRRDAGAGGPRAVRGAAADDPGQRGRRDRGRAARDRVAGRLRRVRRAGRGTGRGADRRAGRAGARRRGRAARGRAHGDDAGRRGGRLRGRAGADPGRRGRRRDAAGAARPGAGAAVVGAVGSDAKRAVVASLGGDGVRYERIAGPFDVVFDGVGGEVARGGVRAARPRRADAVLRPGQRHVGGITPRRRRRAA